MEKANKITAYNIISTIIIQGISALTAPIISRMLGTDNYGIAILFMTWVTIVSTVFGLQTKSALALGRKEYSEEEQNNFQANILLLSLISFAFLSLVTLAFSSPISRLINLEWNLIPFVLLQGVGTYCVSFYNFKNTYEFNAKENLYLSVSISISTTLLSVLLIYFFPQDTNYWGRIIGVTVPNVLVGIVVLWIIFHNKFERICIIYWKFCLMISLPMMVHDLSGILLNQSDRVMLQRMADTSSVGIYSLALGFSAVLSLLWNALNNSWIPFFYEYLRIDDRETLKKRAMNYMELFTVLAVGFILLSNEVFHIYAGKAFWGGTELIPLFAFGYYMVFLYSYVVNFEIYCKKTKYIAVITLAAGAINVVLNYFMIPIWGIYGAAIATTISHIIQFLLHYIGTKLLIKEETLPFNFAFFVPGTVIVMISAFLFFIIKDMWIVRWIIAANIGIYEMYRIYRRKAIF